MVGDTYFFVKKHFTNSVDSVDPREFISEKLDCVVTLCCSLSADVLFKLSRTRYELDNVSLSFHYTRVHT